MKKVIILLWMICLSFNVTADHNVFHTSENRMIMPIIEVIDGDTIRSAFSLPTPLNKISIRLGGINSPESTWRAKCLGEKMLGIEAKNFLKDFIKGRGVSIMVLTNFKYGTYAGRIISDVSVDGVDIATLMLENGYAKYYDGKSKIKASWCEPTVITIEKI